MAMRSFAFVLSMLLALHGASHANQLSVQVKVQVTLLPAPVRCSAAWSAAGTPVAHCNEVVAAGSPGALAPAGTPPTRRVTPATSWQRVAAGAAPEHVGVTVSF
jgi:hypothetical protein